MVYAHRDDIFDADTHMMEHPDWIHQFADKSIQDKLEPIAEGDKDVRLRIDNAIKGFEERQSSPDVLEKAKEEFMGWKHKGWDGLGAFNAEERKLANDLLGFKAHLVFPTSAFDQVLAAKEPKVILGGVEALNKGMAEFCSVDKRMFGAAYIPFSYGEEVALNILKQSIQQGSKVILIDTIAPEGTKAFTHPDFDVVWKTIQDNDITITLHVGADNSWDPVPLSFYNNGSEVPPHKEGDAPRDALAYMGISYNAELFLASMIFDGVFDRFPLLRIGVVELGASWIISWMKHLDQSYRAFRRLQDLSGVKMLPSEYVQKHIKITPFPGEDIGWLLESGASDLLMFASDYPHHEGTDDPITRFEKTMLETSEENKQKFYSNNFKALLGSNL
ncbi:MAG: amidohydrolase family protein [Gammaproteobacteria bacterium]|tara:strand:+ start:228 stop:1394 length:1167 start_codon:yes stop_codon:yes gene_type:complete